MERTVFEGVIHKCPNCGETLNSFVANCPSCGLEIRGATVSDAIRLFSEQFYHAQNQEQRIQLLQSFAIPNTKEDTHEFMILALSNINANLDDNEINAWETVIDRTYQKAERMYKLDLDFSLIQSSYDNAKQKIRSIFIARKNRRIKKYIDLVLQEMLSVLPNILGISIWIIVILILIPLCGINVDAVGFNGFQIITIIAMVVVPAAMPLLTKTDSSLPRMVSVCGLGTIILALIPFQSKNVDSAGFSAFHLLLIIDIICTVGAIIRIIKVKPTSCEKLNKNSFLASIVFILLFLLAFAISSLASLIVESNSKSSNSPVSSSVKISEEVLVWPDKGLVTLLPKPDCNYGIITHNSSSSFEAHIYLEESDEYTQYVNSCIQMGFSVDCEQDDNSFEAYNNDGYKVFLCFEEEQKEFEICIDEPIEMNEISWSATGIAKNIPKPESSIGKFSINSNDSISVYIGNTTIEQFNDYVEQCLKMGFDYEYDRFDKSFYAENKAGDDLYISYEGYGIMYISIINWN